MQSYSDNNSRRQNFCVELIDMRFLFFIRCTWAGDRDGQCISLVCWGIRIKPDDHVFLNRTTGIFRVLQTVLDDARTSMALAADKSRGPGQQGSSPNTLKAPLNISSGSGESLCPLLMAFQYCTVQLQAVSSIHLTLLSSCLHRGGVHHELARAQTGPVWR
jgi:hypothetical protein